MNPSNELLGNISNAVFGGQRMFILLPEQAYGQWEGALKDLCLIVDMDDLMASLTMELKTYGYAPQWSVPIVAKPGEANTVILEVAFRQELFPEQIGSMQLVLYPIAKATERFAEQ